MTTVYLANKMIHVAVGSAGGRVKVQDLVSRELPEALFSGGAVADREGFANFLSALWRENKLPRNKLTVVLGGLQLVNQITLTPKLDRVGLTEYLARDLSDLAGSRDAVIGSWVMDYRSSEHRYARFTTVADRAYLQGIEEAFAAAGLRVGEICSALGGMVKLALMTKELQKGGCIVQFWNGESLLNLLMMDGKYIYGNSVQVAYAPEDPAFAVSVARQASQLLMFTRAQQIEGTVSRICLAGIPEEDMDLCAESIGQVSGELTVERYPGSAFSGGKSGELDRVLPAVGALALDAGKTGLCGQLHWDVEKAKRSARLRKKFLPIPLALLAAAAVCLWLGAVNAQTEARLKELMESNTSASVAELIAEYDALQEENRALRDRAVGLDAARKAIDSYPLPNSEVKQTLKTCGEGLVDVAVTGYDSATGVISLDATAEKVENVNTFAAILAEQEDFFNVNYTGYRYDEKTLRWTVNVVCTLAGDAGRRGSK